MAFLACTLNLHSHTYYVERPNPSPPPQEHPESRMGRIAQSNERIRSSARPKGVHTKGAGYLQCFGSSVKVIRGRGSFSANAGVHPFCRTCACSSSSTSRITVKLPDLSLDQRQTLRAKFGFSFGSLVAQAQTPPRSAGGCVWDFPAPPLHRVCRRLCEVHPKSTLSNTCEPRTGNSISSTVYTAQTPFTQGPWRGGFLCQSMGAASLNQCWDHGIGQGHGAPRIQ